MPNDQKDQLEHLFVALAASEIADEDEPTIGAAEREHAEHLRAVMLDSIKRVKLERRAKAEQAHRSNLDRLNLFRTQLPATTGQRRLLLERSLMQRPDVREITLQNRALTELSDGDIEQLLTKLAHLGALVTDEGDGNTRK